MAKREKVAFLGLGIMGYPQAANLARAGFELTVWNRPRAVAQRFAHEHNGARMAPGPAQAAAQADVVITMVPDSPEVAEVLLGMHGAADGLGEGGLAIDMSTIAPSASISIGDRLRERGIGFMDAPVSGSRPKGVDGTRTIMAGGSAQEFERARPVLEAMGELIVHVGPPGHGSLVKLINNTLAAINAAALAEAISLAQTAGLDTDALRTVVAASSGASTMLNLKAEPMIERSYEPLFKLEHMLKDVRHYIASGQELGAGTQLSEAAERLYAAADKAGLGGQDFAAVREAVDHE